MAPKQKTPLQDAVEKASKDETTAFLRVVAAQDELAAAKADLEQKSAAKKNVMDGKVKPGDYLQARDAPKPAPNGHHPVPA